MSASVIAGRVLDPSVGLELASRTANFAAVSARHTQRGQGFVLHLGWCVCQLFVRLQLCLVGELTAFAELAMLPATGGAEVRPFVVVIALI